MCLIAIAYKQHPKYPLIIVSNRDEFYNRPAKQAHYWEDAPSIYAGRDLQSLGTWLGVSKNGRFAAVTNFRDPTRPAIGERSRGEIVHHYLVEKEQNSIFIEKLQQTKHLYGGYNFLGYDAEQFVHYNNITNETSVLSPGFYSVSNASLNTPWPKVTRAINNLQHTLSKQDGDILLYLKTLLEDETLADDAELPDTGVGIHLERILSAQFIKMNDYGTRSSTTVVYDYEGRIHFTERIYENGHFLDETTKLIKISDEG